MRAVVWIVVGILVVVAVAFVFVAHSQRTGAAKLTPATIAKKADSFMKQADAVAASAKQLEGKLNATGKLTDANKALLADMTAKAGQIRDKAKILQGQSNDLKAATATKDELTDLLKTVNKDRGTLEKAAR